MKKQIKLIFIILIIIALAIIPLSVKAQNLSFSVKPENPNIGYFQFTMNPGETKEDAIILLNFADKVQNFLVKPVDGYTADGGGIAYSFEKPSKYSSWVTTENDGRYRLLGSRIQRIPFSVTVPEATPPGEYYLGMLTAIDESNATPEPTRSGSEQNFMIKVVGQIAIAIVITVPGPAKCDVAILDIQQSIRSGKWRFDIKMKNQGAVHFAGDGIAIIRSKASDELLHEKKITVGYFVPGTEMNYSLDFPFPENSEYQIEIKVSDRNDPDCIMQYEKDFTVGVEEEEIYGVQATRIAAAISTSTPTVSTDADFTNIDSTSSARMPVWIFWVSGFVFLLGIGMLGYSVVVLKKRK